MLLRFHSTVQPRCVHLRVDRDHRAGVDARDDHRVRQPRSAARRPTPPTIASCGKPANGSVSFFVASTAGGGRAVGEQRLLQIDDSSVPAAVVCVAVFQRSRPWLAGRSRPRRRIAASPDRRRSATSGRGTRLACLPSGCSRADRLRAGSSTAAGVEKIAGRVDDEDGVVDAARCSRASSVAVISCRARA